MSSNTFKTLPFIILISKRHHKNQPAKPQPHRAKIFIRILLTDLTQLTKHTHSNLNLGVRGLDIFCLIIFSEVSNRTAIAR